MKKQKIETKYMNLGWFSMWLVANQVSVLISLVFNVQHSVEVGVGVWPCQPSSKWWRLWGVLWDFGATQESLSQKLGQGRTCSTFPNSLSLCSLERAGASTPLLKSQLANAFGEGWEGHETKCPRFTWAEMRKSGFFNSLWDNSGGPRQLPKGGTRIAMEFSSGFHSVSERRVHLWDVAINWCTVL